MTHSNRLKPEKQYIAGFFDGEGWIQYGLVKNKTWRSFKVGITNQSKRVLVDIQKEYGGSISLKTNKKECWQLELCKQDGKKFLLDIIPYLIVKKEKALEFLKIAEREGYFK